MPISISTPISDITFSVLWVSGRITSTPMNPMGIASMIRNGSMKERNCATRIRYSRMKEMHKAQREAVEGLRHAFHHSAQIHAHVRRQIWHSADRCWMDSVTFPRSSPDGVT